MRDGRRNNAFLEVLGDAVTSEPEEGSAPVTLRGPEPALEARLRFLPGEGGTAAPTGGEVGDDGVRMGMFGRSPKTPTLALRTSRLRTPMAMVLCGSRRCAALRVTTRLIPSIQ